MPRLIVPALLLILACCSFDIANAEEKPDLPLLDISQQTQRHHIIAQGTAETYQGHPYSVLMSDQKTIFCVWNINHGGHAGPMAKSVDGGKTWSRLDDRLPKEFQTHQNCPSIYRMIDPQGKARLWVWSAALGSRSGNPMPSIMSEDEGETWQLRKPLGEKFWCTMTFSSMVRLKDGRYLGVYHRWFSPEKRQPLTVLQSISEDGGMSWSDPEIIGRLPEEDLCEPFLFRSPGGQELCCLMRENRHDGRSFVMFSQDEGATWSKPKPTCWGLTGDRHMGVQLDDGRMLIAFRDQALGSPTRGHFVAWVGEYSDIQNGTKGDFRVKLLHNHARNVMDCGYPGVHQLPDGSILALTYVKYQPGAEKHSVVSTRFQMSELEAMLSSP